MACRGAAGSSGAQQGFWAKCWHRRTWSCAPQCTRAASGQRRARWVCPACPHPFSEVWDDSFFHTIVALYGASAVEGDVYTRFILFIVYQKAPYTPNLQAVRLLSTYILFYTLHRLIPVHRMVQPCFTPQHLRSRDSHNGMFTRRARIASGIYIQRDPPQVACYPPANTYGCFWAVCRLARKVAVLTGAESSWLHGESAWPVQETTLAERARAVQNRLPLPSFNTRPRGSLSSMEHSESHAQASLCPHRVKT